MWGGFSASKLKPQLKMAVSRIQIAANKKSALLKQNMREVACLLAEDPPKEEKAKIRAEALIRDDNLIEAYEILQLECELLYERIKLIEFSKECPADLVPVISTLIWASHRVDIPELSLMKKQFRAKYGKKFEDAALSNVGGCLNERVVTKLSVDPPAAYLVQTYLERICEQYEVQWTPKIKLSAEQMIEPMAPPVGYSVPIAQGTGLGHSVGGGVPTGMAEAATATEEINYAKQHNGGMIPPPAPNTAADSTLPSATATLYEPTTGISARFLNPPQEPPPPQQPPAPAAAGDFEEVDIFVPPGAPSAPPGSVVAAPAQPGPSPSNETATSTVTMGSTENNKKDDCCNDHGDDDHHDVSPLPPPAPGASSASAAPSSSSTYEDLAARFNQLKK